MLAFRTRPKLSLPFPPPTSLSLSHQSSHPSSCPHSTNILPHTLHQVPPKTLLLRSFLSNTEIPITELQSNFSGEANVGLLNSRIRSLSVDGLSSEVLHIYYLLRISGFNPDNCTYTYVLRACAHLRASEDGRVIHAAIMRQGHAAHLYVSNSLIDMYAKVGCVKSARGVFDEMANRNLVSWNSVMLAHVINGFPDTAIELCACMQKSQGLALDGVSLKIILSGCGLLQGLILGKSVHSRLITSGSILDVALATATLNMYARCKDLVAARMIFDGISYKDVVCWNAMISGYLEAGHLSTALDLFRRMQAEGSVSPSRATILVVLEVCTDLGILQTGQSIHGYAAKTGLSSDPSVGTLLIDMYSKCGKLTSAAWVFCRMPRGTVYSWSAMINGLGMHGNGKAALMCFFGMLKKGIDPDGICFLLVLSCCGHNGRVTEGYKIFQYMVTHFGIHPKTEHYVAMVDVLGRAGLIHEAFAFICQMPIEPTIDVWGAFLGACRIHGDCYTGEVAREWLAGLSPDTAGYYKLLLGIYAGRGRWEDAAKIRRLIKERGLPSTPAFSFIEIKS